MRHGEPLTFTPYATENGSRPVELPVVPAGYSNKVATFQEMASSIYADSDPKYGLLQLPGWHTKQMATDMLQLHKATVAVEGEKNPYWEFATKEKSTPWHQKTFGGLRLSIFSLNDMSAELMATVIGTQTSCYEAKDTMGDYPSSRKIGGSLGIANDAWLLAAMSNGWKEDDMVVLVDTVDPSGEHKLAPIAGGVCRFGERDSSGNLKTLSALNPCREKIDSNVLATLDSLKSTASIGRLFSIGSIDEAAKRLGDISQYNFTTLLMIALGGLAHFPEYATEKLDTNVDGVLFDTHLSKLVSYLNILFGSTMVGTVGRDIEIAKSVYKTPHSHHYHRWKESSQPTSKKDDIIRVLFIKSEDARRGRRALEEKLDEQLGMVDLHT